MRSERTSCSVVVSLEHGLRHKHFDEPYENSVHVIRIIDRRKVSWNKQSIALRWSSCGQI